MRLKRALASRNAARCRSAEVFGETAEHSVKTLTLPWTVPSPYRRREITLPAYLPELNPAENIWPYLRGNKLANTVYETYDEIVDKACEAWMFFANDKERVASIAAREWARVNV